MQVGRWTRKEGEGNEAIADGSGRICEARGRVRGYPGTGGEQRLKGIEPHWAASAAVGVPDEVVGSLSTSLELGLGLG